VWPGGIEPDFVGDTESVKQEDSTTMETRKNVLIIERNSVILKRLDDKLDRLGFPFRCVGAPEMTMEQLEALVPDLAIIGSSLDEEVCFQCMQKLKIIKPGMPILLCCNEKEFQKNVFHAPYSGVQCFDQDLALDALSAILREAIRAGEESESLPDFPLLVGKSREIRRIREKIGTVADKDITVLITGESGTGKELIARSLHYYSSRNKGPLIKINCGALPDELLESEVFGFQKGAFTGAHKDKPGRLELAHGGTLFVDEIGDLSLSLQVKFLQVLEDKAFSRLGGVRDRTVDTRVVAATNRDLSRKVRERSFRKDLFFRLNVMHIEAPPLRDRREDIPMMADYFMHKYCFEFKKGPLNPPDRILNALKTYPWPGNVRELENVIRRVIVLKDWDAALHDIGSSETASSRRSSPFSKSLGNIRPWGDGKIDRYFRKPGTSLKKITRAYVGEVEQKAISQALRESNWNRKKAAESLGVSYKTLLNRIEELNIRP
jgi:two-component system, NtrC family, response regulator AtoC